MSTPKLADILKIPEPLSHMDPSGPSWIEDCEKRFQAALQAAYERGKKENPQQPLIATSAPGCCVTMDRQLNYDCQQHPDNTCPDVVVIRSQKGEYFLKAANATYAMKFCPWCGKKVRRQKIQET